MPGTLHITHSSTQWRDPDATTEHDFHAAFKRAAAFATFTEVYAANEKALRRIAKDYGYTVVEAPGNDAVCVADGVKVLDHGGPLVNKGQAGKPPHDGHSARHAPWVLAEVLDEQVFVVEAHWVTGHTKDAERAKEHAAMSEAVVALVQEHGRGTNIAFWTGDMNAVDAKGVNKGFEILHAGGLLTCWDELGVYPATHGSAKTGDPIDMIGSFNADLRVTCKAARAWPKVASDHNPISAWYDIAQDKERSPFKIGQRVEGLLPATVLDVRQEPDGQWVVTVDADDFVQMDGANLRPLRGLTS